MHAYSGTSAPRTLRVDGLVRKHCVHILIDSGSTHNFIDERLVRRLGLDAEPTTGFDVAIGDGTKLRVESLCHRVYGCKDTTSLWTCIRWCCEE